MGCAPSGHRHAGSAGRAARHALMHEEDWRNFLSRVEVLSENLVETPQRYRRTSTFLVSEVDMGELLSLSSEFRALAKRCTGCSATDAMGKSAVLMLQLALSCPLRIMGMEIFSLIGFYCEVVENASSDELGHLALDLLEGALRLGIRARAEGKSVQKVLSASDPDEVYCMHMLGDEEDVTLLSPLVAILRDHMTLVKDFRPTFYCFDDNLSLSVRTLLSAPDHPIVVDQQEPIMSHALRKFLSLPVDEIFVFLVVDIKEDKSFEISGGYAFRVTGSDTFDTLFTQVANTIATEGGPALPFVAEGGVNHWVRLFCPTIGTRLNAPAHLCIVQGAEFPDDTPPLTVDSSIIPTNPEDDIYGEEGEAFIRPLLIDSSIPASDNNFTYNMISNSTSSNNLNNKRDKRSVPSFVSSLGALNADQLSRLKWRLETVSSVERMRAVSHLMNRRKALFDGPELDAWRRELNHDIC
mmetsp:Transcript_21660/g.42539  ORF Transcript_21660/g.42539 Transcript_21660/m.42539 type:complete len:468 (-) Transcript_21660:311-1714(-)